MRFWEFGKRNFKELWRDPVALGFLFGMPLAFILIFSAAFGSEHANPAKIGVMNQDSSPMAKAFVEYLKNNVETLSISEYDDENQAMDDLKANKLSGFLTIPSGFGEAVRKNQQGETENIPFKFVYDDSQGWTIEQTKFTLRGVVLGFSGVEIPLSEDWATGIHVEMKNSFLNFFIPGMIIYGLMILVPTIARAMLDDREKGFLGRLLTTPTRPLDFVLGYTLPYFLVIIIQIIIYMAVGVLMGLEIYGSVGLAFLIFFVLGLCCIGIGMIVGTLAKNANQSEPACWIFIVPMAMISGAWFPIEGMHPIWRGIANFFPFLHAIDASRHVITTGASFGAVAQDFLYVVVWTVVFFVVGIILFQKKNMTI